MTEIVIDQEYNYVCLIQITTTLSVFYLSLLTSSTRLKKLYFFQIVKERKNSDLEKIKPKPHLVISTRLTFELYGGG